MVEVLNLTLNFSFGRGSLNFSALREKLASTEVECLVSEPFHG